MIGATDTPKIETMSLRNPPCAKYIDVKISGSPAVMAQTNSGSAGWQYTFMLDRLIRQRLREGVTWDVAYFTHARSCVAMEQLASFGFCGLKQGLTFLD